MRGKVVVVSGATSGIGEVAAVRLAKLGARLVLIARDRARGEATLAHLRATAPDVGHVVRYADLSLMGETRLSLSWGKPGASPRRLPPPSRASTCS